MVVVPQRPNDPSSIPSAACAGPAMARQRQQSRNPPSSRDVTVKAPKASERCQLRADPVLTFSEQATLVKAARSNKVVPASSKAVQQAPVRVRPKVARPFGTTDEAVKPLLAEKRPLEAA